MSKTSLQFRYRYWRIIHTDKKGKYIYLNREKYYLKEHYQRFMTEEYYNLQRNRYVKHKDVRKVIKGVKNNE